MVAKVNVMVVDDQRSIRLMLKAIIAQLGGVVVAEAGDGEEAVALYEQHKPNLVLMDINMPKLDGVGALKKIMAIDSKALVIMLTSQNTMDVVKECLLVGAQNFLLKDNSPEILAKEITNTWKSCKNKASRI